MDLYFQLHDFDELPEKICYDCCTQFNNFWKFREQLLLYQNQKIEEINRFYATTGSQDNQIKPYEVVNLKLIDIPAKQAVSLYKPIIKKEPDGQNLPEKLIIKKESIARNKENAKKRVSEASTSQQKIPRKTRQPSRKKPAKKMSDYDTDDSFIVEDDSDDDYFEPKKVKIVPSLKNKIRRTALDSDSDSDNRSQETIELVDMKSILGKKSSYCGAIGNKAVVAPKRELAGKHSNSNKDGDVVDLTDM